MLLIANFSTIICAPKDMRNIIIHKMTYEVTHVNIVVNEPNLAPNPSFEEGDTMPSGWTNYPGTDLIYHWDNNCAYSGEKSVGVLNLTNTTDPLNSGWITTDFISVDYEINEYIFSGWVKFIGIPHENQCAVLSIKEYDINYQFLSYRGIACEFTSEWQNISIDTIPSNETKYIKLQLGQVLFYPSTEPDPSIEVRFDDLFFGVWNTIPNTPTISGKTQGKAQTVFNYAIKTIDPNQDDVKYFIDWGDNTTTTTDYYKSGEEINVSHIWGLVGNYSVRVKALDEHYAWSDWVTLEVIIPRNKVIDNPLLRFFEVHPLLYKIFQLLFKGL